MNKKKAREILGESIQTDGTLHDWYNYLDWSPGEIDATMDGQFPAEKLEAIAWWMKNTKEEVSGDE